VYFSGALMRMHRAEVHQLVSATVFDQIPLDLREPSLILGEHTFSICASHDTDTTSRRGARIEEGSGWAPSRTGDYRRDVSNEGPFMGVHVAVAEMATAMDFYRRVGLAVPEGADGQPHVEVDLGGGAHLAFSTPTVIAMYDSAWRGPSPSTATVLQLRLGSRAAVDEMYESLTSAGYRGHLAPIDAFWGNRYCEVDDADGHTVGFQSTTDESRRS
jgi:uncharacterized glyoxalase superfamily protein PhnB